MHVEQPQGSSKDSYAMPKQAIILLAACLFPALAHTQVNYGRVKILRVSQERQWVDVMVMYTNTTTKTFASVEIQCVARDSQRVPIAEDTWFHGEAERVRPFPPRDSSYVTVQIEMRSPSDRAHNATCTVVSGRKARDGRAKEEVGLNE